MPIPTSERPFDRLATELVADQFAASPTLGSDLGLTEYDELAAGPVRGRDRAPAIDARTRGSRGCA